jgi:hypothetical protein
MYVYHRPFNYKHYCYYYLSYNHWTVYEVAPCGKSSDHTLLCRKTLKTVTLESLRISGR